ncbi:uncharacterized protein N7529_006381 [Penicillium soppii]|uniref:uncharacterized protein n=1 Tax=Penicillium soppii TaxID=69789 RepID=UPI002548D8CD|nr:uncharacterized protein N7529_006381 [Penicillium soppii]KAJ5864465.1 hypothetical protein N7529_006381 [Penicillium soppii]
MAPPIHSSRSLEGLERVVPPHSPKSPFPRDLFLNKPLPARPLSEERECAMWSDSSDSESTVDSIASEPRSSADSYPIFVSGSDDFELADPPTPSADLSLTPVSPLPPLKRTDAIDITIDESIVQPSSVSSSLSETQYGRSPQWTQSRTGANHYFREKKWDYFPELATPSALQASGRVSPNMVAQNKPRKKGTISALEFAKGKYRWHSLDRGGLGGVRESIKTYVHRTLSRETPPTDNKHHEAPRPATAPMDHHLNDASSILGPKGWEAQPSLVLDTTTAVRTISVATSPSTEYDYTKQMFHLQTPISPTFSTSPASTVSSNSLTTPRQNQLAVPLSPYQKHGPAIWESPKKAKRTVQFLKYKTSPTSAGASSSSAPELSLTNATPTLAPPLKQLQQNTRGVFLGAKKKIVESKDDRRRELLKAQIKFVGPVNPHTYVQSDPWV